MLKKMKRLIGLDEASTQLDSSKLLYTKVIIRGIEESVLRNNVSASYGDSVT